MQSFQEWSVYKNYFKYGHFSVHKMKLKIRVWLTNEIVDLFRMATGCFLSYTEFIRPSKVAMCGNSKEKTVFSYIKDIIILLLVKLFNYIITLFCMLYFYFN